MSSYTYRALSPGCIRLLRLSPDEDESAPVHCRLFEYSLSPPRRGTHLYEALSYCWGSRTKSQTVFTDEGSLQVTENLHAALLRLRDPGLERVIWIDAICINQNDVDEKSQQVQLMAEIYARASRVIVWLENMTGDPLINSELEANGQEALQALEAAAGVAIESLSTSSRSRPVGYWGTKLAVEKLFERAWFRRIWVLQEVAAARNILIMCKSAEIDGQAFCLGFDRLNLFLEDKDSYMRAHSAVSLMRGATIRSKCAVSGSRGISLQILPLRRLVELYHIREATDVRDMVYALLGMSTDTPVGLVPDYRISWKDLFGRLVRSLLSEDISVTTYDEHTTAVIKSKGCFLGELRRRRTEGDWGGQQEVYVDWFRSEHYYHGSSGPRWESMNLQETTKHVEDGDFICLLQGALLPTIVRLHKDYCSIIAIAIDAEVDTAALSGPWLNSWRNKTQFEFLLVWEWKTSGEKAVQDSTFDSFLSNRGLSCINLEVPDDLNITLMFLEAKRSALGMGKLLSLMATYEDAGQSQHPIAVAARRLFDQKFQHGHLSLPGIGWDQKTMLSSFIGKIGRNADATEDLVIEAASLDSMDPMVLLLEARGNRITITENILAAAARNGSCGEVITRLLLKHAKDEITISDNILAATMGNTGSNQEGENVLKCLLLDGKGQIAITEDALITMARNEKSVGVLALLLENTEDQIIITEDILLAAAKNERLGRNVMQLLLRRKGDQISITENVLIAAAANRTGSYILAALFKEKLDQITITENILVAVASNHTPGVGIIPLLLMRKGGQVTITENILIKLLANRCSEITIEFILKKKGNEITVTKKILEAAQDPNIRALLLEHSRRKKHYRRLPTSTKQKKGAFSG